jgi:hypothetical protein
VPRRYRKRTGGCGEAINCITYYSISHGRTVRSTMQYPTFRATRQHSPVLDQYLAAHRYFITIYVDLNNIQFIYSPSSPILSEFCTHINTASTKNLHVIKKFWEKILRPLFVRKLYLHTDFKSKLHVFT